jgi:biotin carboxyl carrier protein
MRGSKKYTGSSGAHSAEIEISEEGQVRLNGTELLSRLVETSGFSMLRMGSKSYNVYIQKIDELRYDIWIKHVVIPITLETPLSRVLHQVVRSHVKKVSEFDIKAPMPGLIRDVLVSPGDHVEPGTPLIVLEAMKMENEIRSSVQGVVKVVLVKKQDAVEKNQMMIEIEAKTDV